ncbi:alanine racemase [Gemella sp. zg-1178]|nr:alanine racemase [Gemella sp. zg-1178]MBU0278321.1 alanine racemase [Gemella sp. zg-1178]QWQ39537.1 alanine racemase [Gemella sp. zg-570]
MIQDRPTYLKVDLDNILFNYNEIKKLFDNKEIMAVIKADAYGLGAKQVGKYLYDNGVKYFAVTTLEEAIELRKNVGDEPLILVLGVINPQNIKYATDKNISLCCPSVDWLKEVILYLDDISKKLKLHLKIDSGMSRIGITTEEEAIEINNLLQDGRIELEGIFSHYANSDDSNIDYDIKQREKFNSLVSNISLKAKYIHQENSAATLRYVKNDYNFNLARVGISIFGQYPSEEIKKISNVKLKNVSSLISRVIHVKKIAPHTKVGYGCTYESSEEEFIATIPIGYRDGLLRRAQGWSVMINGNLCQIVGRVCMDQLMVRCPKKVSVGDEVLFYGSHNNQTLDVEEFANHQNTIHYEIFCVIGSRVPRKYFIANKEVEI